MTDPTIATPTAAAPRGPRGRPRKAAPRRRPFAALEASPDTLDALADARRGRMAAERARVVSDLGGDLSAIQERLIDRWLQLNVLADALGEHIIQHGPLTARGRTRQVVEGFGRQVDRLVRLGQLLGVQRQARPVSALDQYLASRARRDGATEGEGA